MSERKYIKGELIKNLAEYEQYDGDYFMVKFGINAKTLHRGFVESWQVHYLKNLISQKRISTAIRKEKGK